MAAFFQMGGIAVCIYAVCILSVGLLFLHIDMMCWIIMRSLLKHFVHLRVCSTLSEAALVQ